MARFDGEQPPEIRKQALKEQIQKAMATSGLSPQEIKSVLDGIVARHGLEIAGSDSVHSQMAVEQNPENVELQWPEEVTELMRSVNELYLRENSPSSQGGYQETLRLEKEILDRGFRRFQHDNLSRTFSDVTSFRYDIEEITKEDTWKERQQWTFFGYIDNKNNVIWLVPRSIDYFQGGKAPDLIDRLYELQSSQPIVGRWRGTSHEDSRTKIRFSQIINPVAVSLDTATDPNYAFKAPRRLKQRGKMEIKAVNF